ncbi:hypothetical protein [Paenibacillus hexagrammi]|uniref:Holin n=1 Tax=Paenibacillus hexagrammi TaxID=2908839 RepID=A0ABY3SRX3_9BACL|nr:hypothetical protein [Paenibacillus sp. YPD9-1]UJF36617.1 hypothetical protein L0M14_30475 [Paenibacillus sp. YPD9-1]
MQRNYLTLVLSLIGALKLILSMVGIEITEGEVDAVTNLVAALFTVGGIVMTHVKTVKPVEAVTESTRAE